MFTTLQVRDITGVGEDTISKWIRDGYLKPVILGAKGAGNSHMFSVQHVVAIGVLGTIWKCLGGGLGNFLVRTTLKQFSTIALTEERIQEAITKLDITEDERELRAIRKAISKILRIVLKSSKSTV